MFQVCLTIRKPDDDDSESPSTATGKDKEKKPEPAGRLQRLKGLYEYYLIFHVDSFVLYSVMYQLLFCVVLWSILEYFCT